MFSLFCCSSFSYFPSELHVDQMSKLSLSSYVITIRGSKLVRVVISAYKVLCDLIYIKLSSPPALTDQALISYVWLHLLLPLNLNYNSLSFPLLFDDLFHIVYVLNQQIAALSLSKQRAQ